LVVGSSIMLQLGLSRRWKSLAGTPVSSASMIGGRATPKLPSTSFQFHRLGFQASSVSHPR